MRELKFRAWTDTEIMRYDIMPVDDRVAIDLKSPSFEQIWEEFDYMQWTGLKDINGVDIYEGDIINDDGLIMTIEFVCGAFCKCNENGSWVILYPERIEVIGNIYQNPELCEN